MVVEVVTNTHVSNALFEYAFTAPTTFGAGCCCCCCSGCCSCSSINISY